MEGEISSTKDEDSEGYSVRLSEIELNYKLSEINEKLGFMDEIRRGFSFQVSLIMDRWGAREIIVIALATLAFVMGSWDLGIGELSGGGDYNRVGINITDGDSGFLHISDLTLMLSLLSIICWLGIIILLWSEYPIMRENLAYLLIGSFAVQYGYIISHVSNPLFPFGGSFKEWRGVIIGNIVLFFLAVIVVHRAVRETRDIHVQERHAHPDPRVVAKAWEDHSLKVWDWEMGVLIFALNIMSWAGSHAIASRMNLPSENLNSLLILLYIISGILSVALLLIIVWFPHFMLGGAEDRIQSVRAREVAGEAIGIQPIVEQGKCPICSIETAAKKYASGKIEVPCSKSGCEGKGWIGSMCVVCEDILPTRLVCKRCDSNTTIDNHFGNVETW